MNNSVGIGVLMNKISKIVLNIMHEAQKSVFRNKARI